MPGDGGRDPTEIKMGILYPATGPNQAVFSPYLSGIEARFAVANAAGGVNGRKVTYPGVTTRARPRPTRPWRAAW